MLELWAVLHAAERDPMTERRRFAPDRPDGFTRTTTFTIQSGPDKGKTIEAGTYVRFYGEEAQYKFLEHAISPSGSEAVQCIGGPPGRGQSYPVLEFRSFPVDSEFRVMKESEVRRWKKTP